MTPQQATEWVRIGRDVVIVAVGSFMLIHSALSAVPSYTVIAGGLALLGVPPTLRRDAYRRAKREGDDDGIS